MAERQPSKSERKRVRQPISVPFIWEENPGTPKKDWKPTAKPIKPTTAPPAKLVVSVPFGWEEKPGTPIPGFLQPPKESNFAPSQEHSIILLSPPKYSDDDHGLNEGDGSYDSELDTHSVETDDSFSSARSLLANGLISTTALSNAVPVQQTSLAMTTTYGSPASETESDDASSYATGPTNLVGASFLEWLFPLLVPTSSLQNKAGCLEKDHSCKADAQGKELFLHESNSSQVRRPLLTLGELIVMSRRRSCQRKVMKQPSMDFMKRNAFACCIFGSGNGIRGLHTKWKRQLQLKLM